MLRTPRAPRRHLTPGTHATRLGMTFAVAALTACAAPQRVADEPVSVDRARREVFDGRLAQAEDTLTSLGPAAADERRALLLLGEVRIRRGQHAAAVPVLSRVVERDADDSEAATLLARALEGAGKDAAAIHAWTRVLARVPHDLEAATRLARLLIDNERPRDASRVLAAALKERHGSPQLWQLLADARLARGRLPQALDAARKATELGPQRVGSWITLGDVERLRGEVMAAVSAYRKALAIDPQHGHALLAAGLLLAEHGDAGEAVGMLQRRIKMAPGDAGPWNALAIASLRAGDHAQAIEAAERARDLRPTDLSLHANLGTALLAAGRPDDALVATLAARALAAEAPSASTDAQTAAQQRLDGLAIKAAMVGALAAPACTASRGAGPTKPRVADVRREVKRRLQGSGLTPSDDELDKLAPTLIATTRRAQARCAAAQTPPPATDGAAP